MGSTRASEWRARVSPRWLASLDPHATRDVEVLDDLFVLGGEAVSQPGVQGALPEIESATGHLRAGHAFALDHRLASHDLRINHDSRVLAGRSFSSCVELAGRLGCADTQAATT